MHPIMLDVPLRFETERLVLRCPQAGDGAAVNEAYLESFNELRRRFPWANHQHTVEEDEIFVRESHARFLKRTALDWLIMRQSDAQLLGIISLIDIDWHTPKFEILYWLRTSCTGQGYATEAASGVIALAFNQLGAKRVLIRCNANNTRSAAVAQRLGFTLEGTLRHTHRDHRTGELVDELYFAKVQGDSD
ncbi:MAG: GNAT family N-acetyltransferase [Caldilineaceae bacterium]